MTDIFVKAFTHLKDRPKSKEALPMLQRVASLVKPIMRKHGWILPVLSEFFPDEPNLVGKRDPRRAVKDICNVNHFMADVFGVQVSVSQGHPEVA
jgi:hypothetical protein